MFNGFPIPVPDSGGGIIKSVQRGSATMAAGVAVVNVPISVVDVNKAVVLVAYRTTLGSPITGGSILVYGDITSATNVKFERFSSGVACAVEWQVIEFVNIKRLQSGSLVLTTTSSTVSVTPVNPAKSIVFLSSMDSADTDYNNVGTTANVSAIGDGINFAQNKALSKTIKWYLVEFR